jgi:hypothetical protein
MTRKIWLRCFLVSLLASAAAPPVTMIAMAPDANESVADLRAIDPDKMNKLTEQERIEYLKTIPMHRVQGLERITYWFSHPQWFMGWWRAVISWFALFFASTVIVSFLNTRDQK